MCDAIGLPLEVNSQKHVADRKKRIVNAYVWLAIRASLVEIASFLSAFLDAYKRVIGPRIVS